jgi:signal recognition particle subunit SRP54
MGDMLTLIEKAEQTYEQEEAEQAAARMLEGQFTLDDFLEQMQQLKKMGPLQNLVGMLPGLPKEMRDVEVDDRELARVEAIIKSMTPGERADPKIIDSSRRARIARGSGTNPTQVSGLVTQFSEMQKLMKRFGGLGTKKTKKSKRRKGQHAKGRGGGRVTAKRGRAVGSTGRVTPKGTKSKKSPLMLPGLDRLDADDIDRLADELDQQM